MADNKYLNEYYRNPYLQRRTYLNPGGSFAPSVYVPEQADLNLLARSLDKIEERQLATSQQETAIAKMLGELDMNAAEDAWRTEYANQLNGRIKSLIEVGDYSNAMNTAIRMAKDIYLSPAVRGRVRANQEYKKFVDETQRRNDIDQRTKNWALATNKYSYQDIVDENGNIVAGSEWKPNNTPVSQIDLAKLGSMALSWVKPNKSSGSRATFVDAYGNFISEKDIRQAADIAYQTSYGVEYLGRDKLLQAINAAIDMTPGGRAAIEQDYKVAKWEYDKLTPEQKVNIGDSEITDSNGRLLTEKEFINKKIYPWADAASYRNVESKTSYSTGLQTAFGLRNKNVDPITRNIFSPTGEGYAVTYDRSDEINQASGVLNDAITRIARVAPALANTPQWKKAVESNNYEAIEKLIKNSPMRDGKNYYEALSPSAKKIITRELSNIYSNKDFVQNVHKTMDNNTRNAFDFKCAVDAGQAEPNKNSYARKVNELLIGMTGGKTAEQYQIRFNSNDDVDAWLNEMGMSRGTAKNRGFDFGSEDDRPIVTYDASNNYNIKSVVALSKGRDAIFHNPFKETELRALDKSGNIIGTSGRSSGVNINFKPVVRKIGDLYDRAAYSVSKYNSGRNGVLMTTNQSMLADLPVVAEAKARGEKQSEIDAIAKAAYKDLSQRLDGDWAQMKVYGINPDTKTMTDLSNKDRGEQMHDVKAHLQAGKADIQLQQSGPLTGYSITVHGSMKDGVIRDDGQDRTYFVTTGVSDPLLEDFKNDPATRANANYVRRVGVGGAYRTKLGVNISNMDNDVCKINGRDASSQDGKRLILLDELITNLQVDPTDRVSAAKIMRLIGGDKDLENRINNYLNNN